MDFKKTDLLLLSGVYECQLPRRQSQEDIGTIVRIKIQTCNDIPNPNMFSPSTSTVTKCQVNTCDQTLTSDQPSDIPHSSEQQSEEPSTTGQKSKASRKARAKLNCKKTKRPMKTYYKKRIETEETNVDLCGVCSKTEKEDEEWICCDICNIWYHRFCLDLDDEERAAVSSTSSIYTCPMCL